jgi:hypothetical protein
VPSDRFLAAAEWQWPGFHAPPELGNGPVTMDHFTYVRSAEQAAAAQDERTV